MAFTPSQQDLAEVAASGQGDGKEELPAPRCGAGAGRGQALPPQAPQPEEGLD